MASYLPGLLSNVSRVTRGFNTKPSHKDDEGQLPQENLRHVVGVEAVSPFVIRRVVGVVAA